MAQFNNGGGLRDRIIGTGTVKVASKQTVKVKSEVKTKVEEKTKVVEKTNVETETNFVDEVETKSTEIESGSDLTKVEVPVEAGVIADSVDVIPDNASPIIDQDGVASQVEPEAGSDHADTIPEHQEMNNQNPSGEAPTGTNPSNGDRPSDLDKKDNGIDSGKPTEDDQNKTSKGDMPNHDNNNGNNGDMGNRPNNSNNGQPKSNTPTDSTNKLGNPTGNVPKKGEEVDDPAKKKLQDNKHNRGNNSQTGKKGNTLSNALNKLNNKLSPGKDNNEEDNKEDDDDSTDGIFKHMSFRTKIKIVGIGAFIAIIGISSYFLISVIAFIINPESFASGVSSGEVQHVYESDDPLREKENAYYEELDRQCNESSAISAGVNKVYVHYILYYRYFNNMYANQDEDNQNQFDFDNMKNNIDDVIKIIKNVDNPPVDYTRTTGNLYIKLLNDSFLTNYYKDFFKNIDGGASEENKKELLDQIFGLAEKDLENSGENDDSDLPDEQDTISKTDYVQYTRVDGSTGTLNYSEYLYGAIYANMAVTESTSDELIKANTVILLSKILTGKSLDAEAVIVDMSNNGVLYCNPSKGCSKVTNGANYSYVDGTAGSVYKGMASPAVQTKIKEAVDSVFGNVVADSRKKIVTVSLLTSCGSDYKKEITTKYPDYQIINILENNYTAPYVEPDDSLYNLTTVKFYKQTDYNNKFCGRTDGTISTSGCGVVSMAIVASTLKNSSAYDPITIMNDAYNGGYCGKGIDGTKRSFFRKEAQTLGLKYEHVSKTGDLSKVLNALNSKNSLVIVLVGPGSFTSYGHYMVLGGVNGNEGTVFVYDPYTVKNKARRGTGNGWYSFNDVIAKQAKDYYIISKG